MTLRLFVDGVGLACAICGGVMAIANPGELPPSDANVQKWRRQMAAFGWQTSHVIDFDLCPRCWKYAEN